MVTHGFTGRQISLEKWGRQQLRVMPWGDSKYLCDLVRTVQCGSIMDADWSPGVGGGVFVSLIAVSGTQTPSDVAIAIAKTVPNVL